MPLAPLYSILPATILVTVAAPGALAGATSIPVAALTGGIPAGTILDLTASGDGKFAKLATAAAADDVALDVDPLGVALDAGDTATYAPPNGNPLLSSKYENLSAERQQAEHIRAELALGLRAPAYTGDDALELSYAVVLQINYQLERATMAVHAKSVANQVIGASGASTQYRDRVLDPEAVAIVERVTGVRAVRFAPTTAGV